MDELEDLVLGKAVDVALDQSQMVGPETFKAELKRLADGEA